MVKWIWNNRRLHRSSKCFSPDSITRHYSTLLLTAHWFFPYFDIVSLLKQFLCGNDRFSILVVHVDIVRLVFLFFKFKIRFRFSEYWSLQLSIVHFVLVSLTEIIITEHTLQFLQTVCTTKIEIIAEALQISLTGSLRFCCVIVIRIYEHQY